MYVESKWRTDMSRRLDEMDLKELWQLFPVILTEHREEWKIWYREEKEE